MPVYKDKKNGTYYVRFHYYNWKNEIKYVTKRGFKKKTEASAYEAEYKKKLSGSSNMRLADFVDIYLNSISSRVKESTLETKKSIIYQHIVPSLGEKRLEDITKIDIISWQNELLQYVNSNTNKGYTKSYLKTLHNQLSALLNYAVKYYNLDRNYAAVVGNMGTDKEVKINFWTLDQYKKFSEEMMNIPEYYYAFETLYWSGIREGELLALTLSDIDFENSTISVNKTFSVIKGREVITSPKTRKSVRVVKIPSFLCDELKDYVEMLYQPEENQRLFPVTKGSLVRMIHSGAKRAGVPEIRVHDLRHSHVSLLINMGFSAVDIADRVGHESVHITYHYSHMFPNVQGKITNALDNAKKGGD